MNGIKGLGLRIPTLIHSTASVSPSAEIGERTVVVAQAAVNANAKIGRGCILNNSCSIDHDNVLDGLTVSGVSAVPLSDRG